MITIIFGRAAQFLLALAMMRVATTLLTPEEMGRVSLVLTTIAFFALFLVNPVGMFINRRLHAWRAGGTARHYLIRYVSYLLLVAFIAALSLPLLYMIRLADFGLSPGWLIFLVCGSLLFNTINQTAIPSLNMLGDSGRFVLLSVATIAASFACAVLAVKWIQPSAQYWLLGLLLGQAILAAIGTKVLFSRLQNSVQHQVQPAIRKRHLQTLYSFAWPVAIAAGLGWVQGQGYRYLMEGQLGLAQLGLFVAGYGISAGMIAGFESVLTAYFQPRLYRDVSGDQPAQRAQAWHRYAAAVTPSLLLTVVFIMVLAPELTRLFLGDNFQLAAEFVVWGALAEAARVLMGIYSLIAHVYMKTRWLILPNMVGAIFSMVLCEIFIPKLAAIGVGISLVFSGFAVVLVMHLLLTKRVGGGLPLRLMFISGLVASLLWGIAFGFRQMQFANDWAQVFGNLSVTSMVYLGFQYLLLRTHLTKKKEGA